MSAPEILASEFTASAWAKRSRYFFDSMDQETWWRDMFVHVPSEDGGVDLSITQDHEGVTCDIRSTDLTANDLRALAWELEHIAKVMGELPDPETITRGFVVSKPRGGLWLEFLAFKGVVFEHTGKQPVEFADLTKAERDLLKVGTVHVQGDKTIARCAGEGEWDRWVATAVEVFQARPCGFTKCPHHVGCHMGFVAAPAERRGQ